MLQLENDAVRQWCRRRGLLVSEAGAVRFENAEYRCIEIARPRETARRLALAYAIVIADSPEDDEAGFRGCLVRIADRDIWSETFDRVGHRALELFGLTNTRQPTPSFLLESGELIDAQFVTSLPMLFEWDAYIVPDSASFVAFISHDEPVQITAVSPTAFEQLFDRFESGEWDPHERVSRDKP